MHKQEEHAFIKKELIHQPMKYSITEFVNKNIVVNCIQTGVVNTFNVVVHTLV